MTDRLSMMSFPRKLVEARLLALEGPINEHLVKLLGFEFPVDQRRHFAAELLEWLDQAASMRLKPDHKRASVRFYYERLFDYPFGGVEAENTAALMRRIERRYDGMTAVRSAPEVAGLLLAFHRRLAQALHNGEEIASLLEELLS